MKFKRVYIFWLLEMCYFLPVFEIKNALLFTLVLSLFVKTKAATIVLFPLTILYYNSYSNQLSKACS